MNILLLGSGGREHAIAWKLAQSPKLKKLFIAPGNPGTASVGTNLNLNILDFEAVKRAVIANAIDLVFVGPEEPLVKGIHDSFLSDQRVKQIPVIGPKKEGAQLEGSKDFAKAFMIRHSIPTAAYKCFVSGQNREAKQFLTQLKPPYVLKADGLAAGKGVVISEDINEANITIDEFFDGKFGEASKKIVIEEFLKGIELSVFVLTDGKSYVILPEAKDYKRIGDGDTGLNTGGMGAVSPVPFADKDFLQKVEDRVIIPTIKGLLKDGIDYKGIIFIGLMNDNGNPFVIEYNVRMGDPETEVVIPRIENDLVELLDLTGKGKLSECKISISDQVATTVILVSGGYPDVYEKGKVITGLNEIEEVIAFHAGTKLVDGSIVTAGGRVLALTCISHSADESLLKSYKAASIIGYEGKYYRTDIGKDLKQYI
ncbi:MAG: phosphoribosylamine--glycine ligase [Bacteroidales bacterium]|nr:MAG: phosphoribosylamine--glycine ligase [Bacteroidales bacterium]